MVVLVLGFGLMTKARNLDWQSERKLWAAALREAPNKSRVHHNYGASLFNWWIKCCDLRDDHSVETMEWVYHDLRPWEKRLWDESKYHYGQAIKLDKENVAAWLALGKHVLGELQYLYAIEILEKIKEGGYKPKDTCMALGIAYIAVGEIGKACENFKIAALAGSPQGKNNLALCEQ